MDSTLMNVVFEVPLWINNGVVSGTYKIFGGVVRDEAGQIIYHLKNYNVIEKVVENTKKINKKVLIGIGSAAVLAAVGGTAYYFYKNYKQKKEKVLNEQLNTVDKNIATYFTRGNFANLTRNDIDDLINSLSTLSNNPQFINIKTDKEFYNKIVEFSKFINQNTSNLALHKQEQILLPEPNNDNKLFDFVNIAIISLNKQKVLLFR